MVGEGVHDEHLGVHGVAVVQGKLGMALEILASASASDRGRPEI